MTHKFDQLTVCVTQSLARTFLCLAVAVQFTSAGWAEDLYVSAAAAPNGDGSAANPYWRITDAVSRARDDRRNVTIPAGETIVIHVGPGIYTGSYSPPGSAGQMELLPIV